LLEPPIAPFLRRSRGRRTRSHEQAYACRHFRPSASRISSNRTPLDRDIAVLIFEYAWSRSNVQGWKGRQSDRGVGKGGGKERGQMKREGRWQGESMIGVIGVGRPSEKGVEQSETRMYRRWEKMRGQRVRWPRAGRHWAVRQDDRARSTRRARRAGAGETVRAPAAPWSVNSRSGFRLMVSPPAVLIDVTFSKVLASFLRLAFATALAD